MKWIILLLTITLLQACGLKVEVSESRITAGPNGDPTVPRPQTVTLVSQRDPAVAKLGPLLAQSAQSYAVSGDGRYVAFVTAAATPYAPQGSQQAYLFDAVTEELKLLSRTSDNGPGNDGTQNIAISRDGSSVFFSGYATNLDYTGPGSGTLYRYSVATDELFRLDLSVDELAVSADGATIAFISSQHTLVAGDFNGAADAFVMSLATQTIRLVSVDESGAQATNESRLISLSEDGTKVGFINSSLSPMIGEAGYVVDTLSGTLSLALARVPTLANSDQVALSADGKVVTLISASDNLVPGDTNSQKDVFVVNLQTGSVRRASTTAQGLETPHPSYDPSLSGDGRYVAFSTSADLVSWDTNSLQDVYLKDLQTGSVQRISEDVGGGEATSSSSQPKVSSDGRYVAFISSASDLVPGDTNGVSDVFMKDTQTGVIQRVSTNALGGESNSHSWGTSISANARYVAFSSSATNLVPNDSNSFTDVFVKDTHTGDIRRVSEDNGTEANELSTSASISADGRYVAFASRATNLVPGDTNGFDDVFVKDLQTGVLQRVSTDASENQATSHSGGPSISSDGRFIAFESKASNLVPNDTNGVNDTFVKDRVTGTIERASVAQNGTESSGHTNEVALSGNGSVVVFRASDTGLLPQDGNGFEDIYVKDLPSGSLRRIDGIQTAPLTGQISDFRLSGDGSYVFIETDASDVLGPSITTDTNGRTDVYRFHLSSQTMQRVSLDENGSEISTHSLLRDISSDGESYLLETDGGSVLTSAPGGGTNLYHIQGHGILTGPLSFTLMNNDGGTSLSPGPLDAKLLTSGEVILASLSLAPSVPQDPGFGMYRSDGVNFTALRIPPYDGDDADGDSNGADLTRDGRYVVFSTTAPNLIPGDTNSFEDVFLRDTQTDSIQRLSESASGSEGDETSWNPSISATGRFVAFTSRASNLVSGDTNGFDDIFLKELQTGSLERVSTSATGAQANSSSNDPVVSADGNLIAFISAASNLVPGDTNGRSDIFLKNRQTGAIQLLSTDSSGALANDSVFDFSMSSDGRYIAFTSAASNLVTGDTNGRIDVFHKDTLSGITLRVSTDANGTQGNADAYRPVVSADGRFVVFDSQASNLVPGDSNGTSDVFLKDIQTGSIQRVSTDSAGVQGNMESAGASISDDGTQIAFQSYASNLVAGDTNGTTDIFIKDVQTGMTRRASTSEAGTEANMLSAVSRISGDGNSVAFRSSATNLTPEKKFGLNLFQLYHKRLR